MLMDERQIPEVGESAPEFELADSTGVVRRLSEIVAGGLGVVVFYRGHW
jgi:peroxiredoxin